MITTSFLFFRKLRNNKFRLKTTMNRKRNPKRIQVKLIKLNFQIKKIPITLKMKILQPTGSRITCKATSTSGSKPNANKSSIKPKHTTTSTASNPLKKKFSPTNVNFPSLKFPPTSWIWAQLPLVKSVLTSSV